MKEPECPKDERRERGLRALNIIRQVLPVSREALYEIASSEWFGSYWDLAGTMLRCPALEREVERINSDEFGLGLLRCRPKRADRSQPDRYRKLWVGYMERMYDGFGDEIMAKVRWWFAAPPSLFGEELAALPEFALLLEAVMRELEEGAGETSRRFGSAGRQRGIVEHIMLEKIAGILAMDNLGGGGLSEVKLLEWRLMLHTFSQATAMRWFSQHATYRKQFGEFPQWAKSYHPMSL